VAQEVDRRSELRKRGTSVYLLRIPDILRPPAIIMPVLILSCPIKFFAIAPMISCVKIIRGLSLFISSLVSSAIVLLIDPSDLSLTIACDVLLSIELELTRADAPVIVDLSTT
jgi:hypothetical protein